MHSKFLEVMTGKVAAQWATSLLTPAFLFWTGGLVAFVSCKDDWPFLVTCQGRWESLKTWVLSQPQSIQAGLLIGGLIIITISATLVQNCDLATLRFLEGYWPRWIRLLQTRRINYHIAQQDRAIDKWNQLYTQYQEDPNRLTSSQLQEYAQLDWQLVHTPSQRNQFLPTQLGNYLRASEARSLERYGLDAIVCWPRLWLLLPDRARKELQTARGALNQAVRNWLWSSLFLVWAIFAWWPPLVAVLSACLSYRMALITAAVYVDLLESTFDLYRHLLYPALRHKPPTNPAQEVNDGKKLTEYLWRGPDSDQAMPDFSDPPSSSQI